MPDEPNEEIPQQKKRKDDHDVKELLDRGSSFLECDTEVFKISLRISPADKIKRDLLIYMLWKTGAFTKKEIAGYFGLGYSSVSRCVSTCNELIKSSVD